MGNLAATIKRNYFSHPYGDFMGGLTAAIVALPLALAFGVASGLGASAGLFGAIACGIFAALFGGTPGQVSGPTGPMTVVAASMIALQPGRPELLFAAVILGGLLQVVMGQPWLRVGRLVHYIPYPVISGFMSGIGLIIIILQIMPLFGLEAPGDVLGAIQSFGQLAEGFNGEALITGLLTLGLIYGCQRFVPKVPAPLVALLVATLVSIGYGFEIPVIGVIPGGLPLPQIPAFGFVDLHFVLTAAFSLALLGSLDSLLTSVVVDKIGGTRHNSDQELIGQGIGNIASGLIGGLPGAGATMRSVVNINSGGRTNLSGVLHGVFLLAVLLGLGQYTAMIPNACLAGILITVGISIIDYRGLKSIPRSPRADTVVMLTVLLLTVFVDLIMAVGIGIALASVLFIKKLSDAQVSEHGTLESMDRYDPSLLKVSVRPSVYIYKFQGPLFFGEAKNFSEVIAGLGDFKYLILKFNLVPLIDQTGAFTLEDTVERLEAQGVRVMFVQLYPHIRAVLERTARQNEIFVKYAYDDIQQALQAINQLQDGPEQTVPE